MKKILLALLSSSMIVGLTACGGGQSTAQSAASSDSKTESASETAESSSAASSASSEEAASAGEVIDVGEFTVTVPSGWMACPQSDMLQDPDEDGNYPVSTTSIGLIKGGESELDAMYKPTIYIYKHDGDAASDAETNAIFYDECSDIDVTVNGTKCIAFEAKSESVMDENKYYVYNIVFYPVSEDTYFQFNIPIDMIEFEGVSLEDADVQAILQGVALK